MKLTKTQQMLPSAAVKGAYDLKLTPEALARLKEIEEIQAFATANAIAASKISIKDDESDAAAAEVTVNLTKARKALEDLRVYFSGPLEKSKKQIIAIFKKLSEDATGQEDRLRQEAGAWFLKKENIRRDAEAKRLADEEAARARAARLGRSAPAVISAAPIAEVQRSVAVDNGSRGVSLYWGWDEVNITLVPDTFIIRTVNKKAVDAAIDAGIREIPGLIISERARMVVR